MIERLDHLGATRLSRDETIQFACGPHLPCFNSCCRNKRLTLYPYDVLRLRRSLSSTSTEVLGSFVELELEPETGWPLLRLRLDDEDRCPFVSSNGCTVYEDRPTCCRIYPLARATAPGQAPGTVEEFFCAEQTSGCLGWREPRSLTIEEWIADQGLSDYQQANNQLLPLMLSERRRRGAPLNQHETHAVILGLYNLDVFRTLVADPAFGQRFGVAVHRVQAALDTDEALLELGITWVRGRLA